ncbi:sperm microtubule associated protein 2-like [Ochlerotatus camptorhynchus]|uniref:sperm microtubule associated protein 2-like n=1 Tax=Ochlerotatus camptorhynchus TaxID=644619 RepID=UPI0031E175BE
MGCFGGTKSKKPKPSSQRKKCQPKPKTWSQDEWKIHGRYLSRLSQPKKNYAHEKFDKIPQQRRVPLSVLKPRMTTLARPKAISSFKHDCPLDPNKCHCHVSDPIRKVPVQARNYVPTKRITVLSQPKLDYQEVIRCFPKQRVMCINTRVLSYRIKKLATPKYQHLCTPEGANPYGVKPEALVATATARTLQLAQPKSFSRAN